MSESDSSTRSAPAAHYLAVAFDSTPDQSFARCGCGKEFYTASASPRAQLDAHIIEANHG